MNEPTLPPTPPLPPAPPVPPEWNPMLHQLTDARDQAYANWIKQTADLIEAMKAGDFTRAAAILLDCRAHVDYIRHLWLIEYEFFNVEPKVGVTAITIPPLPFPAPLWPPPER